MSDYRRRYVPGGTYFFTLVTYKRQPLFQNAAARRLLRSAFVRCRRHRPFELDAMVLLPDHLHCIWTLPKDDTDFSTRWNRIKRQFTLAWRNERGSIKPVTAGAARGRRQGVWQPRFWEHAVRDDQDYADHFDYIHYNPVKHGHVECPQAWPWSSFRRYVRLGVYDRGWCCQGRRGQRRAEQLASFGERMGE